MPIGIIKKMTDKGFGFIKMEGSEDIFFHNSVCNGQWDSLHEGQQVQFEMEKGGDRGPKATSVVAVDAAGGSGVAMAA